MSIRHLLIGICALCLVPALPAMQYIDLNLVSPITGQTFPALGVPPSPAEGTVLADMGSDDDGCRHNSGQCEYDYYVATDPTSYFSALTVEWDPRSGAFRSQLSGDFKTWVEKTFNGQLQFDIDGTFKRVKESAAVRGEPPPDRANFQLKQPDIPVEMRYWLAYECYKKRNASPATLAKIALNGAWALRALMNVPPPAATYLADGFAEVNDLIGREIKDGEAFDFPKWFTIYKRIFEEKRLSNEGYLVAGFVYFGYALRDGDRKLSEDILTRMTDRFKDEEKDRLRGLVRERRRLFHDQARKIEGRGIFADTRGVSSYITFLTRAADHFVQAVASEEFNRANLPVNMFATAECLRRIGANARAMDWYLALAGLPESQPGIREALRAQGKFPSGDAPLALQLGWRADAAIKRLTDAGLVHPGKPAGPDAGLLNAILNDGFGTSAYDNKSWRPVTGQNMQDLAVVLDQTAKAVLDYTFRRKEWPKTLGELWDQGFVRDRNRLNRFHCPVTGKPLAYELPTAPVDKINPAMVLVAATEAITTNQGPRYGAVLANLTLIWSDQPVKVGTLHKR
jgi:hypothetical protein